MNLTSDASKVNRKEMPPSDSQLMPPTVKPNASDQYKKHKNQKDSSPTSTHLKAQDKVCSSHERRPSIPYAQLIGQAIDSVPSKKITLCHIYNYVMDTYPYFRSAGSGWKVIDFNIEFNPT